jgi:hypothetical protein
MTADSVLIGPKTQAVARKLFAAAEVAEVPRSVVRSSSKGFHVPQEVADIFNGEDSKPAPKKKAAPKTKAKVTPKADEPKKEGAE